MTQPMQGVLLIKIKGANFSSKGNYSCKYGIIDQNKDLVNFEKLKPVKGDKVVWEEVGIWSCVIAENNYSTILDCIFAVKFYDEGFLNNLNPAGQFEVKIRDCFNMACQNKTFPLISQKKEKVQKILARD